MCAFWQRAGKAAFVESRSAVGRSHDHINVYTSRVRRVVAGVAKLQRIKRVSERTDERTKERERESETQAIPCVGECLHVARVSAPCFEALL